ncbi:hypothetical protein SELMODRAFT_423642 [Selaginella moellendorffii]|uniref:Uncharacterized protein n=1 Tax=Selaginella moellendorffii TaxID=88036 RepID=D8SMC8_SELML|nr:uncharacterized protein LOC9644269 [Selaginella moellendorffii]EFJ14575.1 hypothetical protein SELMODRAFT_423642 [Selaginella moellendorffii]|eukprot:XP_002984525.1 uncharacterized protein LOC9644269 [Selaginella moellendorffii]
MASTVRSRRRRVTQPFRDRECERCDQEAQDSISGVACCQVFDDRGRICEDSEISALLVSTDASSAENLASFSQDCRHAAVKEGEEEQIPGKKRRSSSWSGLALPRLCGEKNVNAAGDACKKLGFVVTRKMRALSLDDNLHALSSRMKLLCSRDDSYLPLVASDCSISQLKDLAAAGNPSSRHHSNLNIDDQRSQSFDSRRYDLVGSPGPKFLLANRAAAREEQGESSFKCSASVPFKWEEAPGKPKPSLEKPDPTLQLPPRLSRSATLHKSAISSNFSQRRAQSVNHRQGLLLAAVSLAADGNSSSPAVQHGTADGKTVDPSSPTSILCGPDQSSASCSASSSDTISDSAVVSDAESGTTTSVANPAAVIEDCFKGGRSSVKVSITRSIERILHPDWLRSKREKFRGSQDVEMWAPTLAAYFHSIEGSESAKDESASVPSSGQIVLLQRADEEGDVESDKVLKLGSGEIDQDRALGFEESAAAGGAMSCGCASPRLAPSRFRLMRSASSSGQRRWVVTRIRRSSRLLQMFVFKAVRCAVQPRRKSPLESSKLVYHPVKN